jgi:hypothetical protein
MTREEFIELQQKYHSTATAPDGCAGRYRMKMRNKLEFVLQEFAEQKKKQIKISVPDDITKQITRLIEQIEIVTEG